MSIILEKLIKRYDGQPVVNNVSLEVKNGEFFVLLGSSGSGKTTILNLIAGLTPLDSGQILLNGREVTSLPTQQRRVGFVFQNYALFQYMTVAENIEFSLNIRKVPKIERQHRRDELLDLVGLGGLGGRMPRQLSGGQQQRVALARALAYQPDVLLLDEPLGALDAKIRIDLRRSLRSIQRQLGIATILVTHDQEEAFDLADRIGVMSYGRLLEVGPPSELYRKPRTEFVATFLGSANLMVGKADSTGVCLGQVKFPSGSYTETNGSSRSSQRVQVLFRPEEVALASTFQGLNCPCLGEAEVEEVGFNGAFERLRLRLPPLPGVRAIAPAVSYGSETLLVEATRPPDQSSSFPLERGQKAYIGVRRIHTIEHPGLNFLILNDGSMRAQYALELAGQIGRMAQARITLLYHSGAKSPSSIQNSDAKKTMGNGLVSFQEIESDTSPLPAVRVLLEKQTYDLVIMGFSPQEDQDLAEDILQAGDHNLLLVPAPQTAPGQAMICVTMGEPGKDDIFFAGRLVYHMGAEVSLVTVLPGKAVDPVIEHRAQKFLEAGVKTLGTMGVPATFSILHGIVDEEISKAVSSNGHDLLVMGVPLAGNKKEISFDGVVGEVIEKVSDRAVLLVRSQFIQTSGGKL
jgi:sulfate/thiosulfate transport system ATP-binding protein